MLARMVQRLIERGYVRTARVEQAFRTVPRHLFLPGIDLARVYSGEAVVTRRGSDGLPYSSSSEPGIMAVMAEQLRVEPGQRVLEIGTGTGYNAAILATLAAPGGLVTSVDLDEDITREARAILDGAGFTTVRVVTGDGWLGVSEDGPFDRIETTASVWDLSPLWRAQLRDDGVLVVPLILRTGQQASVAFQKHGGGFRSLSVEPAGFMRLRGPHGGPPASAPVHGWVISLSEQGPEVPMVLEEVLRAAPRVETVPVPPQGWFMRAALHDPGAFSATRHCDDRHLWRAGIFVPERKSLAVLEFRYGVDGCRLLAFGDGSALARLRSRLEQQPMDIRRLTVDAVPAGAINYPGDTLVLRRLTFDFVIRYPTGPIP